MPTPVNIQSGIDYLPHNHHRPDGEDAARVLDALAHALHHRGRDLGSAGMFGRADPQDVALVRVGHERSLLTQGL